MPPLSIINAENTIRLWCETLSNVPFYHANQNIARNEGLYGTVRLTNVSPVGFPYRKMTDVIVDEEPCLNNDINQFVIVTLSINAYRIGARDCLNTILASWSQQQSDDILYPANMAYEWSSDIRDLTTVIEGNFEERAQMDMMFNSMLESTEILQTIGTAQFDFETFNRQFEVNEND